MGHWQKIIIGRSGTNESISSSSIAMTRSTAFSYCAAFAASMLCCRTGCLIPTACPAENAGVLWMTLTPTIAARAA
ncbi:MAG TPA: hypothetical protein DGT21_25275 [Armatimonadetes bacterium]|nr:hypothetical protein [Armatimonadota bacterium]